MDLFGIAIAFLGVVFLIAVRMIFSVLFGFVRGQDLPPGFAGLPAAERLRHALDNVDPCRLGVLGSQDVYPRVVAILDGDFERRPDYELEAALAAALREAGGCAASPSSVRKVLRMVRR